MASGHISNGEFFTQLASLIEKTQKKGHGSVHLTQKRLSYETTAAPSKDDPLADLNPAAPLPILVRVSDGNTQSQDRVKNKDPVKFATVVQADELETFFARYAEVCKVGMQSLRKRDRSKRKKTKKGGAKGAEAKG
ncbi:hypothetical protein B0A48_14503 [Cryoendolithus antarcticus]|uniref:Signal recognition particle subunit SRP14 n=1 Tax=Cryoendolithus antarcticus TaxID=1507870 RepID=A0A1V8SKY2_9PEZI|nr:hypothetical protein B0A48_14503 [Cryoendolithus antarcticus]